MSAGALYPDAPNMRTPEGQREYAERRYRALEEEQRTYLDHWRELSDYIFPRRGRFLAIDHNKGGKKNQKIIDNTATRAARTLAAGLMAGATSPARPWFKLGAPDPGMMEYAPVKEWLSRVEHLMREVFNRSNFYTAVHSMYTEFGVFGTGPILIDENPDNIIHVHPMTVGSYAIGLSSLGTPDTLTRNEPMTVLQIVNRFGLNNCSTRVQTLYRNKNYDQWIEVRHLIAPNDDYKANSKMNTHMRWKSCYWEHGTREPSDKAFLYEGGYNEFPAPTARWDVRSGDVYGSSPAMEALGDIKQLQQEQMRKGQGIDKLVNPPMTGPTSLRNQASTTLPGGVTYVDSLTAGAAGGFRPAYTVDPKLGELRLDINDVQMRIKETFYEDLFRAIISLDRRQITAREIEERHEEKLLLLGPVIERMHSELLDPIVDRVFAIMVRARLIPPAPQELAGQSLNVEYISVLAQAQRAVGISAVERLVGFSTAVAQLKPDIVDKLDFDQMIDEYAHMAGTPPKLVVPDEVVVQRRKARAEMQAREAQMAQRQQAVDAAQQLGSVPLDQGRTALTEMTNPVG